MGKEIDIQSIQNARIKALAYQIDTQYEADERYSGNGDGKINSAFEWSAMRGEVQLFEKGKPCTLKDENDINELKELLGFESNAKPSAPAEASAKAGEPKANKPVVSTPIQRSTVKLSKDDLEDNEKAVKKEVEIISKSVSDFGTFLTQLQTKFDNPEYGDALNQVAQIVALVEATNFNSKEDVDKIEKTVKKQLGKTSGFQKAVLSKVKDLAKRIQTAREAEAMIELYNGFKAQDGDGKNYEKYLDAVKQSYKDNKKWGKSYSKDAFKALETYVKETIGKGYSEQLLERTEHSGKEMRNNMKKGVSSKIEKKAIDNMKKDTDIIGRKNKVEDRARELEHITRKELIDKIGKDTFEKLNRSYLNKHMNNDGTYNLADLSREIVSRIGADFRLSREDKDKQMAEFEKIKVVIMDITGADDLNDTDVKDIVKKLSYIDIEGRDRSARYIANEALGGLPETIASIAGAALGAFRAPHNKIHMTQHAHQEVNLVFNDRAMAQEILNGLQQAGLSVTTSESAGGITINITQDVLQELSKDYSKTNALCAAIPAAAAAAFVVALRAGIAAIFGGDKSEISCFSVSDYDKNDPRYTDPELYKAHVRNTTKNKQKADKFCELVDEYVKAYGEDWHVEFQNDLRTRAAGTGSKLNPDECLAAPYVMKPVAKPKPKPEPEQNPEDKYFQTMVCEKEETENFDIDVRKIDGTHTGWAQIVKGYEGCWDGVLAQRPLRAIKVIQAITDGDYSAARLKELVNKTLQVGNNAAKLRAEMGNIPGFDVGIYIQVLQANMPGKEVKVPKITKENGDTCEWKEVSLVVRYRGPKAKGGVQSTSARDRGSRTNRSFNGRVIADGVTNNYNNRTDYNSAVEGYKAKGYTEKHRKCDYKD